MFFLVQPPPPSTVPAVFLLTHQLPEQQCCMFIPCGEKAHQKASTTFTTEGQKKKTFKILFLFTVSFSFQATQIIAFLMWKINEEIKLESCIFTGSFHMCWCVSIATSSVLVFRDLCLHMSPMATRSVCFWDYGLPLQTLWSKDVIRLCGGVSCYVYLLSKRDLYLSIVYAIDWLNMMDK